MKMAIGFLKLLLAKINSDPMKKTVKNNNILQEVRMDGCINFHANGDINIMPCPWEDEKEATDGKRVRYRGGIEVDSDGRTRVKRYLEGKNGPKLDTLFETAHGVVKITRPIYRKSNAGSHKAGERLMYQESVYVTFKFPKKYGLALIKEMYAREADEMMSFFNTRKEKTIWK